MLKNALDWIVSSGEFMGKPVALINARPASTFAQASLRETLTVMMAEIDPEASVTLPVTTNRLDEATLLATPALSQGLTRAIEARAPPKPIAPMKIPHDSLGSGNTRGNRRYVAE
ncbi:MAG: NADPH-dependent reductase [Chthonomonadaceae bacterium]|nr:NADPH-dependent reductase [Chthonomonadaceae bacterium]